VAAQAAQTLASERLEPIGLSPRAWGVISTLVESGPLTQIQLATTLSIDRTAMVYLLDELEEANLVERVRNPDDRRSYLVRLTSHGRATQGEAAQALASQADTLLAPLTQAQRRQFLELLTRITDHWYELRSADEAENC
jgi:DNA-binding MarR family transcriptional regulator